MKYHKISIGIIAFIAVFGFIIPFATTAYCDSVQVFDDSCLRLGGTPYSIPKLAGAEIYYEYFIYHMNPYLKENPNVDDELFKISGHIPTEFPNQITLKYNDKHHNYEPEPRSLLLNLHHNSTVTVYNESQLSYNVLSRNPGNTQLFGTLNAESFWNNNFTNIGLYTFHLEPISEHDNRIQSVRIFVIDEPIEDIPKSMRNQIACRLLQINHTEYPFATGSSCGGYDSESITIDLHKSMRGAGPEIKQEFIDKISRHAGFLEPEISFEYENRGMYWSIPFPMMILPEVSTLR